MKSKWKIKLKFKLKKPGAPAFYYFLFITFSIKFPYGGYLNDISGLNLFESTEVLWEKALKPSKP